MPYQNKEVKMAYIKGIDYQEKINEAVAKGDYAGASKLELARNEKIESEGLSYEKTNKYYMPNGVDGDTYNQYKTKFATSDDYAKKQAESNNAASTYKDIISKDNIISDSTKKAMNKKFAMPSAVIEADTFIASQLQKIQSGKTSYSDQVREMMDKIMNREKFSYDVDTDPLFQQALASAMNSGKQAMQDTIGQASALTGGYGSTYATSAGNQAYNSFIEDAYDNLPQYYQMAKEAYQMEGDEMYRQFGMVSELDDKEFNRNIAAYDATYQHRNQLYNEAYGQYRDEKSDAFSMANLELNEYGQRVSDAYNYYNIASNEADKQYQREYQSWYDVVNQAYQMMQMQNSDWQNQTNRDFQAAESEKQRVWQSSEAEKERAFTASENAKNRAVKSGSGGSGKSGSNLTTTEMKKLEEIYTNAGGGQVGLEKVDSYLSSIGKNNLSEEASAGLQSTLNDIVVPEYHQNWTISKDTKNYNNWFVPGNDDNNDVYTNGSTTMTFKELKNVIEKSDLDEATKKAKIDNLRKQSKK